MRARLFRYDENGEPITPRMLVAGEEEAELDATEADILIAHMQAFVDTLRALRRQMGGSQ